MHFGHDCGRCGQYYLIKSDDECPICKPAAKEPCPACDQKKPDCCCYPSSLTDLEPKDAGNTRKRGVRAPRHMAKRSVSSVESCDEGFTPDARPPIPTEVDDDSGNEADVESEVDELSISSVRPRDGGTPIPTERSVFGPKRHRAETTREEANTRRG